MNSVMNDHASDIGRETNQNQVSDKVSPLQQCHTEVPYCTRCRDVCLGVICRKCSSRAAMTTGTLEQYKHVAHVLMNDCGDWREMLESMISDN